jgi:hypothetical protein
LKRCFGLNRLRVSSDFDKESELETVQTSSQELTKGRFRQERALLYSFDLLLPFYSEDFLNKSFWNLVLEEGSMWRKEDAPI